MDFLMWLFLILLAVHWIADFVCQTHWQASNKSKNNVALSRHVLIYTAILGASSFVLFGISNIPRWLVFVVANGALHFITDYFTSRWSSRHFTPAIRDTHWIMTWVDTYKEPPSETQLRMQGADPGRHYHNFFVVIGFDQLIHQTTLAVTLWWYANL